MMIRRSIYDRYIHHLTPHKNIGLLGETMWDRLGKPFREGELPYVYDAKHCCQLNISDWLSWYAIKSCFLLNSSPLSASYSRQWTWSALVQVMACRLFGAKPLPEPMLAYCQLDSWELKSWNLKRDLYIFIQWNALENAFAELAVILSRPHCHKALYSRPYSCDILYDDEDSMCLSLLSSVIVESKHNENILTFLCEYFSSHSGQVTLILSLNRVIIDSDNIFKHYKFR